MDQKPRRDKKHPWRPHYVLMDLTTSAHFSESGVVVVCENLKTKPFSNKRTLFVISIFTAFVLGFSLGTIVPVYIPQRQLMSGKPKYAEENKNISNFKLSLGENSSLSNRLLVNGIFWSDFVERSLPEGFRDEEDRQWRVFVQNNVLVRIERGCGRMQNRLVTFKDGTKACCRYRQNTDQIQGEIFSYYLGKSLKLRNLVPSTLVVINSSDPLWFTVRDQLAASQWLEEHPVVLTKYVEGLVPAGIPTALRHYTTDIVNSRGELQEPFTQENVNLHTHTKSTRKDSMDLSDSLRSEKDTVELAQWSDLIVFDYLTANLDRIVNNMYNLQWNPGMMGSPAHNLARDSSTDLLVFLDNESGLLHGYRLLDKYEPYHSLLLDGLCVFRESTVTALSRLQPRAPLALGYADTAQLLPPLPEKNIDILSQRIARVLQRVVTCAQRNIF